MTTIASFAAGRTVLRWLGVSPAQYQLLVDLFDTLGDRKELLGNLGMDKHAMQLTTLTLVVPGGLLALMAFGSMSLASFNMLSLAFSSMLLCLILVNEAANSFFNPAEVTVLAHQPIGGGTYFAAKFSYLVLVVLRVQASVSGPSAIAGLVKDEARWFYPLTHMFAACAAGIFLALVACAIFGVLFRLVPTSKVRNAAMWAQLTVSMLPLIGNLGSRRMREFASTFAPQLSGIDWSFVPVTWFNAIALAGQGGGLVPIRWPAAVSVVVCGVLIALGVRSLSAGYLTRIVGVLRSTRRRHRTGPRFAPFSLTVQRLTGRPSGRAAFAFLMRMMRTDWQFRRAAMSLVLPMILFVPAIVLSGRDASPFQFSLAPIGLLPEMLSVVTLTCCLQLAYSDHYKGAWIFGTAPGAALTTFLRGLWWSLWLVLIAVPIAAATIFFGFYWGVVDSLLFAAYSVTASSLLLSLQLLLVEGFPFASPPKAERANMLVPFILFGPVVFGIAWFVQGRLIFRSRPATVIATVVLGFAAKVVMEYALGRLQVKSQGQIARLGGGATAGMFEN